MSLNLNHCLFLNDGLMIGQSIKCDFCGKVDQSFAARNANELRIELTSEKGWYFMKIERQLHDFCSDDCCQKWLLRERRAVMA